MIIPNTGPLETPEYKLSRFGSHNRAPSGGNSANYHRDVWNSIIPLSSDNAHHVNHDPCFSGCPLSHKLVPVIKHLQHLFLFELSEISLHYWHIIPNSRDQRKRQSSHVKMKTSFEWVRCHKACYPMEVSYGFFEPMASCSSPSFIVKLDREEIEITE